MMFVLKQVSEHGVGNPIVARLAFQTLTLIPQTTLPAERQDALGSLYHQTLMPKLLRCGEIETRYREALNERAQAYQVPTTPVRAVEVPQVQRLVEECHNFLYEAKSYLRGVMQAFNILHSTEFEEPSEFTTPGKRAGRPSLVAYAEGAFGPSHATTDFLRRIAPEVESLIRLRNAVEHPDGYSGSLHIENFELEPDGRLREPTWRREKDGSNVYGPQSIAQGLGNAVQNLLTLGEAIFIGWALENLSDPDIFELVEVPPDQADPACPVRWVRQPNLAKLMRGLEE